MKLINGTVTGSQSVTKYVVLRVGAGLHNTLHRTPPKAHKEAPAQTDGPGKAHSLPWKKCLPFLFQLTFHPLPGALKSDVRQHTKSQTIPLPLETGEMLTQGSTETLFILLGFSSPAGVISWTGLHPSVGFTPDLFIGVKALCNHMHLGTP